MFGARAGVIEAIFDLRRMMDSVTKLTTRQTKNDTFVAPRLSRIAAMLWAGGNTDNPREGSVYVYGAAASVDGISCDLNLHVP